MIGAFWHRLFQDSRSGREMFEKVFWFRSEVWKHFFRQIYKVFEQVESIQDEVDVSSTIWQDTAKVHQLRIQLLSNGPVKVI